MSCVICLVSGVLCLVSHGMCRVQCPWAHEPVGPRVDPWAHVGPWPMDLWAQGPMGPWDPWAHAPTGSWAQAHGPKGPGPRTQGAQGGNHGPKGPRGTHGPKGPRLPRGDPRAQGTRGGPVRARAHGPWASRHHVGGCCGNTRQYIKIPIVLAYWFSWRVRLVVVFA